MLFTKTKLIKNYISERTYSAFRNRYENNFYSIPSKYYDEMELNFTNLKIRMEELYYKQNSPESLHKQYYTFPKNEL